MTSDRLAEQIKQMFYHGPPDTGGTPTWMVGMWVWWRSIASFAALTAAFLIVVLAYVHVNGVLAVFLALFVGSELGEYLMKVSPKYEVKQNY